MGTPGGRQSRPTAAVFKVRDTSQTQAGPRQRQLQSGRTKAREQTGESSLVIDLTATYYPSTVLIPPLYIRVWQMEVSGIPPLHPPSHTHSPCFLKSPRSAGRWRPRNTTMSAGATRTVPMPTSPKHQARRLHHNPAQGMQSAAQQQSAGSRQRRGGTVLQVLLPPSPLVPPLYRPRPSNRVQGQKQSLTDRETEAWSLRVPGFSGQYD